MLPVLGCESFSKWGKYSFSCSSSGPLPHRAVHHSGQCCHGWPGSICWPLWWLLQLCLWRLDKAQPPPWWQIPLGNLQQPVGAQHACNEALVGWESLFCVGHIYVTVRQQCGGTCWTDTWKALVELVWRLSGWKCAHISKSSGVIRDEKVALI